MVCLSIGTLLYRSIFSFHSSRYKEIEGFMRNSFGLLGLRCG